MAVRANSETVIPLSFATERMRSWTLLDGNRTLNITDMMAVYHSAIRIYLGSNTPAPALPLRSI